MGFRFERKYRQFKNNSKAVLFVTTQLRQREIKLAFALKSMGWRVGLIYFDSTPFKPQFFDFAWQVDSAKKAHYYAKKIAPSVIHLFSGAIDDYVLLFCREKIAPVVIDLNDVFTPSLMDYCPERYEPTKEALSLADGFCARDLQVKCAEYFDHCQLPDQTIFFPEYCWNKSETLNIQKSSQEIHIVSVGAISLETYGMYDCCYLEIVKKLIKHGIHIHFYPPWSYRKGYSQQANVDFKKDYAQFIELSEQSHYLHLHHSLPVEELAKVLPNYDFGIISGGCSEFGQRYTHFKPNYVQSCYSGRISDYLDAGLPVLINSEVTFDHWLLNRYDVSFDLKEILHDHFKEKLLDLKQDMSTQKKIKKAKEKLSITTNAPRLAQFYSNVMLSKTDEMKVALNHSIFKKMSDFLFSKKLEVIRS